MHWFILFLAHLWSNANVCTLFNLSEMTSHAEILRWLDTTEELIPLPALSLTVSNQLLCCLVPLCLLPQGTGFLQIKPSWKLDHPLLMTIYVLQWGLCFPPLSTQGHISFLGDQQGEQLPILKRGFIFYPHNIGERGEQESTESEQGKQLNNHKCFTQFLNVTCPPV